MGGGLGHKRRDLIIFTQMAKPQNGEKLLVILLNHIYTNMYV